MKTISKTLLTAEREEKCTVIEPGLEIEPSPSHSEPHSDSPPESELDDEQMKERSGKVSLPIKKLVIASSCILVLHPAGMTGYQWFQYVSTHEETEDAYITGHLHQVSSRIDGTVEKVWVEDNQHVMKGQVLVTLDSNDYRVKVEQALANLQQAERQVNVDKFAVNYQNQDAEGERTKAEGTIANAIASISKAEASVREAQANILSKEAELKAKQAEADRAEADFKRFDVLARQGAVTLMQRDSAKRDYVVAVENRCAASDAITQATERLQQAQETVNTCKAQLTQAQAQKQFATASSVQVLVNKAKVDADLAAVARAKAALDEAKLNLSYTHLVAAVTGRVGKKTAEVGHRVQPGEPVMTIVSEKPWVVANFKETQLKRMKVGQKVEIKIDALPEHKFEGRILSFSPASGTSFAVLPSDNATGNFTKIVQRLPVKIAFEPDSIKGFEDRLAPGLSVVASVDLNSKPVRQLLTEANQ